ncbi:glutathione S-transferase C-terminal-like protein [Dacryopinax primogenitus]|uniref:Glutathione S-transferase C-terminal-like protein n=1 Tax=Dacryopinax primogenitus (strain DJM 731) TaxID=1858805 RepID=M5FSS3_DACPD|nr:glutathione S-transferase C-terminal-like protein [Dacryopinax primogenitus]EJU00546.1 glutathione S-transferase C-terminal-like protein [Dacryopinax primogenitus]
MPSPDEHIHPTATGAAAQTVASHSAPTTDGNELVFWSGWFCPFVARAWLALEEKGIPYRASGFLALRSEVAEEYHNAEYKEVNPYKKEPEFLAISPKGLVPAITYRGKPLHESLVICDFLEEAYPDTPSLYPKDPYDRAQVRLAIDLVGKSFLPPFFRLLQSQEPEKQAQALEEVTEALKKYSKKIVGPYYMGSQFTLADIVLAPWVARLPIVEKHRNFSASAVGDKFVQWVKAVQARESFKKILSEEKYYEEIYGRYLRDEAMSEAAKATRAGRAIP